MEKDKGLFSFRKHPVGNLLDGKKGRKRKEGRLRRALGMMLATALIFNTLPASGLAVSASGREQENCTHQCSEESGCIKKVLDCSHGHDESCGYAEAQECGYVCDICNGTESEDIGENNENTEDVGTDTAECICKIPCTGDSINGDCPVCGVEDADLSRCKGEKTEEQEGTGEKVITAWDWIDPEEYLTDGMLALPGAGRENLAFMEDVTALLPEKIQAEVAAVNVPEDGKETEALPQKEGMEITLTGWECASYPEDGAYEGAYTFTALLPEGFVLTEDAAALEVKVELGGAGMLAETVSVSYQEASWNGSEVTYTGKTKNCTVVESSTEAVTWNAGWYAVNGTVTIDQPITVSGTVNLILTDDCNLTAEKGIVVTTGNSLTIYAQSGGTGTLTATGTVNGQDSSAGIGGSATSFDSGSITIHGGVINATSGEGYYAGAGIGGGSNINGNGGTGNNITIYGGSITAESRSSEGGGAGIGGGAGGYNGGAGNITIRGGTVRAAGGNLGAGIGGGSGGMSEQSGNGTVTISGGTVAAIGGNYAAGIGGGGGYSSQYISLTGGTGSVTISDGIVDASSPTDVVLEGYKGAPIGNGGNQSAAVTVSKDSAIVFENGVGAVCGNVVMNENYAVPADYSLRIPIGASLSGSGKLIGGGTFTADLSEDMVSLPADLYFNGQDRSNDIKIRLSAGLTQGIAICGQTFTVSGWMVEVSKTDEMTYTATYTNDSDSSKKFTKEITLQQSGTEFVGDGVVETYKDGAECSDFTASDTITVKATPTATGQAPAKAAARLRGGEPGPGQMTVFVGDTQVSEAKNAELDGSYTMEVNAADVLLAVGGPGTGITLTARFVENANMAGAEGTVNVSITAAAKIEKGGTITYVDAAALDDVFAVGSPYAGATVTLLENVERTEKPLSIEINCILDLGGHTISYNGEGEPGPCVDVDNGATVTIRGTGEIIAEKSYALVVGNATVTLEGGTFTRKSAGVGVGVNGQQAELSVTNEKVLIRSTGGGTGLGIGAAKSVKLFAGTYSGEANAISFSSNVSGDVRTLRDLLATGCAYYDKDGTLFTGNLDGTSLPGGTYTVKACDHSAVKAEDNGDGTHSIPECPVCGYTGTIECTYGDKPVSNSDGTHKLICTACSSTKTEDCSGGTATYTEKAKCERCGGEYGDLLKDTVAPTGEISIGENTWNSFLDAITFGPFFKNTEPVTITAADKESGVASVSYYISGSGLSEEEVKKLDNWTAGNTDKTTFSISKDESCVVYAKITDNQGNVTYISSDGLIFDGTSPSITGVTNGGTYCTPQTVTVTDDNLESVTVNGNEQTLSDGSFTLDMELDVKSIVIEASDKAGNITTVTVNAGHNYGTEWKSDSNSHWQECSCGNKSGTTAHTEDGGTVTKVPTKTETGIRTYKCSICGRIMRTEEIAKLPDEQNPVVMKAEQERNAIALNSKLKVSQSGKKISIRWGKVTGADGYDVYVQYNGKKFTAKNRTSIKNGKTTKATVRKVGGKALNLKKIYKVYVLAYKMADGKKVTLGKSMTAYVAGKNHKKYTNAKAVKVKKVSYQIKKGKTAKIKAEVVLEDRNKKQLSGAGIKKFLYISTNKKVAVVSAKGKIKALGKGKCYIYVCTGNGCAKKIKVTVR